MFENLLAQRGFTPSLLVIGFIMYGAWTAAYLMIIARCFRDKTYGVPMLCICLNISWEFLWSFNLLDQKVSGFFMWGNRIWLVIDAIIFYQLIRFGPHAQVHPFLRKHFYPVLVGTLVFSFAGIIAFTPYFGDFTGSASSMTINLIMSLLFIAMWLNRPDSTGLSYSAAWFKMVGTFASSLFLYSWLPGQFVESENGVRVLATHPWIVEPRTYSYMYFLYIGIFLVDCFYIYLLGSRNEFPNQTASASNP